MYLFVFPPKKKKNCFRSICCNLLQASKTISASQLFMSAGVDAHWTKHWLDQKCTFVNATFLMKPIRKMGVPETAVSRGYFVHASTK